MVLLVLLRIITSVFLYYFEIHQHFYAKKVFLWNFYVPQKIKEERVKNKNLFLMVGILIVTLFLNSCLTLPDTVATGNATGNTDSVNTSSGNTGWSMGQFVNEWGDKTDKYYMQYSYNVRGVYSNNVVQNATMSARNITFSEEEGLTFDLHESDDSYFVFVSQVNVIIKIGNSEETFNANPVGIRTVHINFSDQLLRAFQREENMLFRVTTNNRTGNLPSYYQFELSPRQFNRAYENLKSMVSE